METNHPPHLIALAHPTRRIADGGSRGMRRGRERSERVAARERPGSEEDRRQREEEDDRVLRMMRGGPESDK